jgi:hypothetical protein
MNRVASVGATETSDKPFSDYGAAVSSAEDRPTFATFWHGDELPAMERACLRSFVVRGYALTLYAYQDIKNLPASVLMRSAAEIAPRSDMNCFIYRGAPNLSHFSDYFRYKLFGATDHVWVDTDMVSLRRLDFDTAGLLIARERVDSICGAILKLDAASPEYRSILAKSVASMNRELSWGETGPASLTTAYARSPDGLAEALPPEAMFPLPHDEFWKVWLPEYREECEEKCNEAYTLHLWNNLVEAIGYWKELAPPLGSFLYSRFETDGSLAYFRDVYPDGVVRHMVETWRRRKDGGDLTFKRLTRQAGPAFLRMLEARIGAVRKKMK